VGRKVNHTNANDDGNKENSRTTVDSKGGPDASGTGNDTDAQESEQRFERRKFLKAGATAAAVALSAGQVATVGAAETYTVDPADGSAIDGPFMDAVQQASDGDTISVASGTYTVDGISNDGKALTIVGGDVVLETGGGGTVVDLSGDGWTFDGFGFDYGNTTNPPGINLSGSGWRFANTVFWNTKLPSSSGDNQGAILYPNVPSGAVGRIENCYLHDGEVDPDGYADYKAVWAGGDNIAGTLVVDGMWCEHWAENTLYLSNNSGTVEVYNSYFRNTNVSGPRITDSAHVENTTFVLDGKPPRQYRNGSKTSRSVRGLWWNAEKGYYGGNATVRGCDFVWKDAGSDWASNPIDATDGGGGDLVIEDTNFLNETGVTTIQSDGHTVKTSNNTRGSADATPPIPDPPTVGTTPNSGSSDDGSSSDDGTTSAPTVDSLELAEVETDDADAAFDASWQVSDADGDLGSVDLTLLDADDGAVEESVSVDVGGDTASGTTRLVAVGDDGAGHAYEVELTVTDAEGNSGTATGTATESESTIEDVWKDDELNTLAFEDVSGNSSQKTYHVEVAGTVEPGPGANLDDDTDTLRNPSEDEWVVDGVLEGGLDDWLVDGKVTAISVSDTADVEVSVNGVVFSPSEIEGVGTAPSSPDIWNDGEFNRVSFTGGSASDTKNYEVVVSGDVDLGPGANLDDGTDKLIQTGESEYTIRGILAGGADDWDILGEVTATTFDDGIATTVNGTEFPTEDLEGTGTAPDESTSLPNTVIVEGVGRQADYEFTVSGDLVFSTAEGASVDQGDLIDDSTARGTVDGGTDAYAFSGDVVDLSLDGNATLRIEDEE
jgi:hypothetical protein